MFYYYQIRNHHYKTEPVPAATCPLCNTRGQMHMSVLQKYTWMVGPMAPSSKYAIAWCENCGKYIPRVKWTDEMDAEYISLKQGLKTPARLFRGLWVMPLILVAFIAVIVGIAKISSGRQQNNQAYVTAATLQPRVGDIFQVNHSQGQDTYYTFYKVASVIGDSVFMQEAVAHPATMDEWDEVPTDASAFGSATRTFSLAQTKSLDGMFSMTENGMPAFGIVFGVWRDGELHKKY